MNKPTKQKVYLPVSDLHNSERAICTIGIPDLYGDKVIEQEGYFFTPEQLNEYTQKVIKQALEIAAKSAAMKCKKGHNGEFAEHWSINKQSITNTFEETFKKFEV